jgi:hypothetical protein
MAYAFHLLKPKHGMGSMGVASAVLRTKRQYSYHQSL